MSSLSSSQDSFKTAPEFQPPEPLTQYVHVFEGNNSTNTRYLFVKNLGTDGIYQSQLVLQQLRAGVFKPAVRMVYRRRTFRDEPSSHSYFDRLHDNNLAVTRYLYCGLLDLRVPLPYFENHFVRGNKVTRASYWSFANGGSLGRLLENMGATAKQPAVSNFSPRQEKRSGLSSQTGLTEPACVEKLRNLTLSNPGTRGLPPFPRHLALHLLYQLLETLEKMYNHPRGAVFHTNITAETLHLHFEESNDLPDLILTNFSHAVIAPFSKKATWDIPSVLSLILKHLPELNDFISPLQTLHDAFLRNRQAATPNPSGQYTYTIPSLAPLLAEFQAATPSCSASDSENPRLPWIREMADFHDEAYLAPQAYNTIDAILDTTGIHGPWRVGEFDPMTGMAIVPVPFAPVIRRTVM
ncbi:hypothetical protein QBC34DRAFT_385975 [Podospora aff. communis PSN243]|uniref:Protein kinase domain-containing protein n=1 Tax=Podospora aff. communis PSN243 TaxID=3040156 RepID=A0AAV9G7K1_9PEZI|nr:hypothetical protein QBC34DRAFT_385975 [Podospora aff. communis PSN243]